MTKVQSVLPAPHVHTYNVFLGFEHALDQACQNVKVLVEKEDSLA